jgi:hypothetical protein
MHVQSAAAMMQRLRASLTWPKSVALPAYRPSLASPSSGRSRRASTSCVVPLGTTGALACLGRSEDHYPSPLAKHDAGATLAKRTRPSRDEPLEARDPARGYP